MLLILIKSRKALQSKPKHTVMIVGCSVFELYRNMIPIHFNLFDTTNNLTIAGGNNKCNRKQLCDIICEVLDSAQGTHVLPVIGENTQNIEVLISFAIADRGNKETTAFIQY